MSEIEDFTGKLVGGFLGHGLGCHWRREKVWEKVRVLDCER